MSDFKRSLFQFVKFGIVGVSSTIINYGIYVVLIFFDANYVLANFVSFTVSVFNSFFWNNCFVFKKTPGETRVLWKILLKTYTSYSITGIFLSTFLLWLWISVFDVNEYLAPLINLTFTVPINYFLNKYWAYQAS